MEKSDMKVLFIILNAGFAEDVVDTARGAGIIGATIIHARGAGAPKAFLGITVDTEKEIVFSVTDGATAERVMAQIKEKHGIHTAAHSVCFLMPVEKVVGISTKLPNSTAGAGQ